MLRVVAAYLVGAVFGVALVVVMFPLLLLEMAGYWIVARNRHRISGRLGMNQCKVRYAEGQAVADR